MDEFVEAIHMLQMISFSKLIYIMLTVLRKAFFYFVVFMLSSNNREYKYFMFNVYCLYFTLLLSIHYTVFPVIIVSSMVSNLTSV